MRNSLFDLYLIFICFISLYVDGCGLKSGHGGWLEEVGQAAVWGGSKAWRRHGLYVVRVTAKTVETRFYNFYLVPSGRYGRPGDQNEPKYGCVASAALRVVW